jgi:dipeptidyl aminopeptidase/acylaminoacyl peptidase
MLALERLIRVPYIEAYSGYDFSADGSTIAYSYNQTGQWEIYLQRTDKTIHPRQITTGPGAKLCPCWSPDGNKLAFLLDQDGGECYDLCVYDLSTGSQNNLTPESDYSLQPNLSWSPDGEWIAFISDQSGTFDTYILPAAGGTARLILSQPYHDWEVRWSPDGQWLLVVSETEGQDFWTYLTPVGPGETRIIANLDGPICAKDSRWSPDSQQLVFSSNLGSQFEIGIYTLATDEIQWITGGPGEKEHPDWSPDGQRLCYLVNQGPRNHLAVYEFEHQYTSTYAVAMGIHHLPHFLPDSLNLTFIFENPCQPPDLWRLSIQEERFQQLTCSLPEDLVSAGFRMPSEIEYPSLDGTPVPALLYAVEQGQQPPAVVYVHGGPNWLTQMVWDPLIQHMVSRGWLVLAPNYRGSTGYGRAWQLANRFDLGGIDTKDVAGGADYLVQEGLADPGRMAVTGRSWGGYLTMTCLTQYPDKWVAGSAVVPFLNWFTGHANSRADLQHWDRENFGDPQDNYDLWYERSPYFFLDKIKAAVQLICGAHDPRCPASESIQANEELLKLGVPCDFTLYPDEGHQFLKTETQLDAEGRRIEFLRSYLDR